MKLEEFQPDANLRRLLGALVDDRLSDDDFQQLSELLEHSAAARDYYVNFMSLHAALQWEQAALSPIESAPAATENAAALRVLARIAEYERSMPLELTAFEKEEERRIARRSRRNRGLLLAASIALMLGIAAAIVMMTTRPTAPSPISTVAVLEETAKSTWVDEENQVVHLSEGQALPRQTLRLSHGVAKVRFNSGAVIVLDSRAHATQVELLSDRAARVDRGRLTVHARQGLAEPFSVMLPGNQRLVDVRAELGLVVDQAGTSNLVVFEGNLKAQRVDGSDTVIETVALSDNSGLRLKAGGGPMVAGVSHIGDFVLTRNFNQVQRDSEPAPRRSDDKGYVAPRSYVIAPDAKRRNDDSYPDWSGRELTDGNIGTTRHQDPAWIGWCDGDDQFAPDSKTPQPRVTFDFGGEVEIAGVEIVYLVDQRLAIYPPDLLAVSFSNDADASAEFTSDDFERDSTNPGMYRAVIRFGHTKARYLRLDLFNDKQWTFVSEVRFLAVDTPR